MRRKNVERSRGRRQPVLLQKTGSGPVSLQLKVCSEGRVRQKAERSAEHTRSWGGRAQRKASGHIRAEIIWRGGQWGTIGSLFVV